ncbi:MAG: hypothetical protein HN352_11720 [Bacteroidetes bacterium]|jgi:hypothetical protein|nr:hypothetical protein [Bacteroidota bacterium]MBT4400528.1 hypothetical protein [Bacteroidota bacterium]MBT4412247.1 hypothetical protein [Bacteroidota bacterium]MBT5428105.1 hypothetical protein [Bacteroidota bacterium]MBT7094083.1 hypothetical protein [Bacteroidota bacterium]
MSLIVKQIGPEYNEEMLAILLESPMESDGLSLCLDRSPDIFIVPRLFFKGYKAYGFFMNDQLVGYGMICQKELYVNGKKTLVGYFANLYVKKEARKLGWLYKAAQPLFEEIGKLTDIGFASTVKGNKATESMIGRRISKFPLMPHSESVGLQVVHNLIITFRKRLRTKGTGQNLVIRRGRGVDIAKIAELLDKEYRTRLFGVVMDEQNLRELIDTRPDFGIENYWVAERDGIIVGVCSAWDIRSIRQVRIMAYRKKFKWVYMIYSYLRPLFGFPMLPKPGDPFKEIIVNDFACENRDPTIFEALLRTVYKQARKEGYNMVEVGSYYGDPMLKAVKPFFTQEVYSHTIVGTSSEEYLEENHVDVSCPYIDIALT